MKIKLPKSKIIIQNKLILIISIWVVLVGLCFMLIIDERQNRIKHADPLSGTVAGSLAFAGLTSQIIEEPYVIPNDPDQTTIMAKVATLNNVTLQQVDLAKKYFINNGYEEKLTARVGHRFELELKRYKKGNSMCEVIYHAQIPESTDMMSQGSSLIVQCVNTL